MAKITKRFNIKGDIDSSEMTITEYDKELGENVHFIQDIMNKFDGLHDVTLTLSYEEQV